jgi:adenylate cyclase
VAFLLISATVTNAYELNSGIFEHEVIKSVLIFTSSFSFLSVVLYVGVIILVSLFYSEVSDNLGQEAMMNLYTGKYHKPIKEERVFMFLDKNSYTNIDEKIGHVR